MSGLITDLSSIGSIDRTTDVLEIVDVSANGSFKVTPNALVGISGGSVVSTTDSQTLQNKVIDNSNSLTIKTQSFTIQSTSDVTKQFVFSASSITAGNTRTLTVPDASGTLVLTAATQTLTNKTLTAPTISGGTIDNSTITVDSIAGHTSSTIVTVAGLQINNGVVGTNGVATASISDGAVTPAKLVAGTGSGWASGSWTPTWTNLTIGNSTQSAVYIQIGKTVIARVFLTLGSSGSVGTAPRFSLPVTASSTGYNASTLPCIGTGTIQHVGVAAYNALPLYYSTTASLIRYGGTSGVHNEVTATAPFTWSTGDIINVQIMYEAA